MKLLAPVSILTFLAACGGDLPPDDNRVPLPDAPQNGFQIVLPEMTWSAGEDKQLCWFTTLSEDRAGWVQSIQAFQAASGHHLVIFSTTEDVADGAIEDCSDGKRMKFWRLVFTPVTQEGAFALPDGYGIRLPANTKLVFQVHYMNARRTAFVARDAVNFVRPASTENIIGVAPFSSGIIDFVIPARSEYSASYECAIDRDMNAFTGLGHMHEHGASILVRAGNRGTMEDVYRVDEWTASYRDRPPLLETSVEAPYVFKAGTTLRTTCTWRSEEDVDLGFPQEMCAAVFWVYPAEEPVTCSASTISCAPVGSPGNELHVGEYCTRGGGQCDDNGIGGNAILCARDFRADAPPFCTRACRMDSECGTNALCLADPMMPGTSACVPIECMND